MIATSDPKMVYEFFARQLDIHWSADFRGVMFVPDEHAGQPASMDHVGVAYGWNNFIGRTCVINIIVQKKECLTRAVVRAAFEFPFKVANCVSVVALVDSTNLDSMELCRRAGFHHISTIESGGMEGDLVIWEMRKNDCPWLRKEH